MQGYNSYPEMSLMYQSMWQAAHYLSERRAVEQHVDASSETPKFMSC